ncbi:MULTISPECIES: glycoside hydrolase family 32 protein [unclassified Rhizobium]|uniref:glycoside hydrolase family 32 protein n=1 Tax=unclassified Rhizobium TaxID=2613769 RepID=UPI001C8344A6|nr:MULTISPECIES: glycoside hydrolase family 32 protein [unclassified Rhizobium]MBX5216039.1 glycoside hydrolase family 32 protein [Rhizobium sp. NLR9a]MBX5246738.1 glycoside hydrolase family 32 protein [Rhizobium sp. NLR3b]MBX5277340.1 glycoside hydrolase family 32 protein [Rhizobium sp. NLR13a]MBX5283422.1 glycoside hydrolase family 32 protein [Rhizobium sp. NLR10a]MBX5296718.1 glycoside hydrolase family 32 protein [Rhizobium sp. NLR15a]
MTRQVMSPSDEGGLETISAVLPAGSTIHAWIKASHGGAPGRLSAHVDGDPAGAVETSNPHEFEFRPLTLESGGETAFSYDPVTTEVSVLYAFRQSRVHDEGVRLLHVRPANAAPEAAGGYHFRPPFGWMNDPNGFGRFGGRVHLFYQHYPHSLRWNNMHWGHAVSEDYLHWTHLPIFLPPSDELTARADGRGGAFSGSAIPVDGAGIRIFFTEHLKDRQPEEQVQFTATSRDLVNVEPASLILPARPAGLGLTTDFRDPYVFMGPDDKWKMLLGTRDREGGVILLYETDDPAAATGWTFLDILHRENRFGMTAAECPCLVPLDGPANDPSTRWALIFGLLTSRDPATGRRNMTIATVGHFDGRSFSVEFEQELDFGTDAYAFQSFVDDRGPVGIAWLANWTDVSKDLDMATAMTLPRRLALRGGALITPPVAGVESLRQRRLDADGLLNGRAVDLANGAVEILLTLQQAGNAFRLTFEHPQAALEVLLNDDGLSIPFSVANAKVSPRYIAAGARPSTVRIFLDAGSIEVFADDGRWTGTKRLPGFSGVSSVRLIAPEGNLLTTEIWQLGL